MTAECPLHTAAARWPDQIALIDRRERVTFAELDRRSDGASEQLRANGIRTRDRVAILSSNGVDAVIGLFGLLRIGAIVCPLPTRYPKPALEYVVSRLQPQRVLLSSDIGPTTIGSTAVLSLHDIGTSRLATVEQAMPVSLDAPATVILTSGSMGEPKLVVHSLRQHLAASSASNERVPLSPGDRWLWSLPWYHVGGLAILLRCVTAGATIVVAEPSADLGLAIRESGATHVSAVSTQLKRIVQSTSATMPSLRALLCGGSELPVPLVREAIGRGFPIYLSYGLTEFGSQVCTATPDQVGARSEQCGRPLSHCQVRIEQNGELLIRGDSCCLGYLESNKITRPVLVNGWFHTGDTGSINDDSSVTVTGRLDNRFVSAGVNVVPEEIERVLLSLLGIERALVVPVADPEHLSRPVAFVSEESGWSEDRLRTALRDLLPAIKIPVRLFAWPADWPADKKPSRPVFRELAEKLIRGTSGQ